MDPQIQEYGFRRAEDSFQSNILHELKRELKHNQLWNISVTVKWNFFHNKENKLFGSTKPDIS